MRSPPILALLTQVYGDVRIISSDRSREIPARVRQALVEGDRLELADGAQVTVLCANSVVLQFDESVGVTPELCGQTAAGGVTLNFDSLELVGEARGEDRGDFDQRPVIVSPRCPQDLGARLSCHQLLTPPTSLRWLEARDAQVYYLELTGPRRYKRFTVHAAEAVCSPLQTLSNRRVCSFAWPVDTWALMDNRFYRLEVVAVTESESLRSGKTLLLPLPTERAKKVRQTLDALSPLGMNVVTEVLTRATIYTGSGFVNEAVLVLEPAAQLEPSPVLDLALGDAYLRIDLPELAVASYRNALVAAGQALDLRGEAELGLGRALSYLGKDPEAVCHLRKARLLFSRAEMCRDEQAALEALAKFSEEQMGKESCQDRS